jgi:hypothetical protein
LGRICARSYGTRTDQEHTAHHLDGRRAEPDEADVVGEQAGDRNADADTEDGDEEAADGVI